MISFISELGHDPALRALAWLNGIASGSGSQGRLLVMIYHQVMDRPDPMRKDEVDVSRFSAHMDLLARYFNVLPLDHAIRMLKAGRLPAKSVSITFDDGYRNNYINALPVLEERGLTATFFIATGFLDGGRMWNDTVIEAFRTIPAESVHLPEIGLDEFALTDVDRRSEAAQRVIGAIKHLPYPERTEWVSRIGELTKSLPDDLMMTAGQVQDLRQRGMAIGGHTVNHPILATLDEGAAEREIGEGKEMLEGLLKEKLSLFAYPNGRKYQDYGEREIRIVGKCGFSAALTTNHGASARDTNAYELKRFTPWDRTRSRFMLRMARYYRM